VRGAAKKYFVPEANAPVYLFMNVIAG
jgi:hypothetical protein